MGWEGYRVLKKIIIFLLICISLIACSQQDERDTDLEAAMYSVVKDDNNTKIPLSELTAFSWDKAFLFTSYTPSENIEKKLGTKFKDKSNIEMREDIYLLVFLEEGEVVKYAELDRQGLSFSVKKGPLTPLNDAIIIERD